MDLLRQATICSTFAMQNNMWGSSSPTSLPLAKTAIDCMWNTVPKANRANGPHIWDKRGINRDAPMSSPLVPKHLTWTSKDLLIQRGPFNPEASSSLWRPLRNVRPSFRHRIHSAPGTKKSLIPSITKNLDTGARRNQREQCTNRPH